MSSPPARPPRLEKTPALPPYPFTTDFKADATLSDTGLLKGHVAATYRDDQESLIRALARNVAPAEWDKASQYLVSNTGFTGTTGNTRFPGIADYTTPATLTYDYTRKAYGDWDNLRIIPLSPAITIVNETSATKAPQHDIELGAHPHRNRRKPHQAARRLAHRPAQPRPRQKQVRHLRQDLPLHRRHRHHRPHHHRARSQSPQGRLEAVPGPSANKPTSTKSPGSSSSAPPRKILTQSPSPSPKTPTATAPRQ